MANIKKINVGGTEYEVRSDLEERIKTLEEQETGGGGEVVEGTTDYSQLENKPSINKVTLEGNKTLDELGIPSKQEVEGKQDAISQVNVTVNDAEGTPSGSASVSGSTLNINLENIKGRPGEAGPANTLTIGTVTPSDSPDEAKAEITGKAPNQILNLTLPRGQQGNSGVTGDTSAIVVVNDLNGGESETNSIKVLAAEQGKVLDGKIHDARYFEDKITKEYTPSSTSYRASIGRTLKAGVKYTVQLDYTVETGNFTYLAAHNSTSGNPTDILTPDIEYTPTIDVSYWYITMASDYVQSAGTLFEISVSEYTDSKDIITNLQSDVTNINRELLSINEQIKDVSTGKLLIVSKEFVPNQQNYRPSIGATLKAGTKYIVQLDYTVETGNFTYLAAHNSSVGNPADKLTNDLYNQKGSLTIEYTPSIDVTNWYIQMASNFVASDNTLFTISVSEEVEVVTVVKDLQENVETLKSSVKGIGAKNFELSASSSKDLTENYARNETAVSLRIQANALFAKIRVQYGSSAYVDISDNSVELSNGNSEQHNLNLASATNIGIFLEKKYGSRILIKIVADGNLYITSEIVFAAQGGVSVKNLGSNTLNFTSFLYCPKMINYDLWILGDSYLSSGDPARWPYWISEWGWTKYYIDQLSGGTSATLYKSLTEDLKIKKPKYIIWALGMNDHDGADTINQNWLSAVQNVMKLADEGIDVILCTIPSVPTINHSLKNEFVKSSGFRYIDFASAVEKGDGSQNWHDGLLSSDGVHPSEDGAKILAAQVLLDYPELCTITR